ncbi:hypothetical protein [Paenibacillus pini]|uniref:Uncharacterized protein n=1 Tax=Paenibacillus pini JCM 16418 TaxID=1236976 RepID=W7YRT5_9BACL|nr:hypothetical protein [Paenibacillus pini]GAF07356.1 hypothetical protein JCM16418_1368 [Paenibacillus pini JCM 16418]
MTIALVYRDGPEAFFIQDFRITHDPGDKQIDAMMKYKEFGERLGIFFAGDVTTFKRLIPYIQSIEHDITMENIIDPEGPLAREIERYMMNNPDNLTLDRSRNVELIGFIIDEMTEANECFYVEGTLGLGSRTTQVPQRSAFVIGSGKHIPDISRRLTNIATQVILKGYPITDALDIAKNSLKDIIARCGSSVYRKLGISPVFAGSVMNKSHFLMIGEQITGNHYTSDFDPYGSTPPMTFDYSFSRVNGQIMLTDHISGKEISLDEVESYIERPDSELFDPEQLTQLFDPSEHSNSNGVVYIINQWVIGDYSISRTIDKTYVIKGKEKKDLCNPDYQRLADGSKTNKTLVETTRYIRSGKHFLIVPTHLQVNFERNICKDLFNHRWFNKHVANYNDLYR